MRPSSPFWEAVHCVGEALRTATYGKPSWPERGDVKSVQSLNDPETSPRQHVQGDGPWKGPIYWPVGSHVRVPPYGSTRSREELCFPWSRNRVVPENLPPPPLTLARRIFGCVCKAMLARGLQSCCAMKETKQRSTSIKSKSSVHVTLPKTRKSIDSCCSTSACAGPSGTARKRTAASVRSCADSCCDSEKKDAIVEIDRQSIATK